MAGDVSDPPGAAGRRSGPRAGIREAAGRGSAVRLGAPTMVSAIQAPDGSGHGLVGMRERAALYGGAFTAEPREDDEFAVRVHLPVAAP